ncbi:hypothetical protein [Streptomyces sp. MBT53]|uniref:hypothetical protein n=1 Tax=Streptomyces sp. MBT53 TaxID=1488384 RepID=UPI001F372800|nr:hypothetical protein [Streptomyces sp. MBT53]
MRTGWTRSIFVAAKVARPAIACGIVSAEIVWWVYVRSASHTVSVILGRSSEEATIGGGSGAGVGIEVLLKWSERMGLVYAYTEG